MFRAADSARAEKSELIEKIATSCDADYVADGLGDPDAKPVIPRVFAHAHGGSPALGVGHHEVLSDSLGGVC